MSNHQRAGNQSAPLLGGMLARALHLGASAAAALPARDLVVADHFAALCAAPHRCPSYGLAPGCPPHSQSPAGFRAELADYRWVLVFRIDVPAADLRTGKRLEARPWAGGAPGRWREIPAGWAPSGPRPAGRSQGR